MKFIHSLVLGILVFLPSAVFAQTETISAPNVVTIDSPDESRWSPEKFACQIVTDTRLSSVVDSTVEGADISFSGYVENKNSYPLINTGLWIQIYKKSSTGEAEYLVDQFAYPETLHLNGFEQREVSFTWHVPEKIASGEYVMIPTLAINKALDNQGHFLSPGNLFGGASFSIQSASYPGISFLPAKNTVNEQVAKASTGSVLVTPDTIAEVKMVLRNEENQAKSVQVLWEEYADNPFQKANKRAEKRVVVDLGPAEEKTITYAVTDNTLPTAYVAATATGQFEKSVANIQIDREELKKGKILFATFAPNIGQVVQAEPSSFKACVDVKNTSDARLHFSLMNTKGDIVQEGVAEGVQSSANAQMISTAFTPNTSFEWPKFQVVLSDGEEHLDTLVYEDACLLLWGKSCTISASLSDSIMGIFNYDMRTLIIVGFALLPIILIGIFFFIKRRRRVPFAVLLAGLLIGIGTFGLSGHQAEAASNIDIQWVNTPYTLKDYLDTVGQTSYCASGWISASLSDDSKDAERHIGEEDTNGIITQMCLRSTLSGVNITSSWTTSSCPSGTVDTGVRDDAGDASEEDDEPPVHATGEADFRPDNSSAYRWCLGASGGATLTTRWVTWASSTHGPACGTDETRLLTGRNYNYNLNSSDIDGSNQMSLCAQLTAPVNNPPTPPVIAGPSTGTVNVSNAFTARSTDPEGNTVRYGIDWDNNNTVDQWSASYLASGAYYNFSRTWTAVGTYSFKAVAQDSAGATSGWSNVKTITISNTAVSGVCGAANGIATSTQPSGTSLCNAGTGSAVSGGSGNPWTWTCNGSGGGTNAACSAPYASSAPVVDLRINGSNGPLTVAVGSNLNLTWASVANANSCTASGTGWTGSKATSGGNNNVSATATSVYTLSCTGPGGTASDSVSVTLSNSLKICQNSCSSGIGSANYAMTVGATKNLVACWNTASNCSNSSGNVTTSATWSEGGGNPISLSGSNPKVVTANNTGTEGIAATYSSQTDNVSITVTCIPTVDCSNAPGQENYCQDETFNIDNGCGATITCNGTKACNYNWREVAP